MRIVVHGGAGHSAEEQDGVDAAADIGWELLAGGADAVSAAVATVVALEDDPRFNAGTGSCLRADGSVRVASRSNTSESFRDAAAPAYDEGSDFAAHFAAGGAASFEGFALATSGVTARDDWLWYSGGTRVVRVRDGVVGFYDLSCFDGRSLRMSSIQSLSRSSYVSMA